MIALSSRERRASRLAPAERIPRKGRFFGDLSGGTGRGWGRGRGIEPVDDSLIFARFYPRFCLMPNVRPINGSRNHPARARSLRAARPPRYPSPLGGGRGAARRPETWAFRSRGVEESRVFTRANNRR